MYDSAIGAEISSSEEGSTCPKRFDLLNLAKMKKNIFTEAFTIFRPLNKN